MVSVEKIKKALRHKKVKIAPTGRLLSSGSTLLNLACTGTPEGAFLAGHMYWLVGDSDSGKTFLSLTCFAEATLDKAFDDYRLIYDAPEGGALMDIERFFGHKVFERMEPPSVDEDGNPRHSATIQDFYYHVDDALKGEHPFIYVLDSHDCLTSKEEVKKFDETKKLYRRGKEDKITGSYGDSKAKFNSGNLRKLMGPLAATGSILIIISQTRDSFDPYVKSTAAGGRAFKFYATLQLWSSPVGKIKRTVKGKNRQLGINAKVQVKKNRVTGRDRTVVIRILHSSGLDDVGSCVGYLIEEGVWKKNKNGMVVVTGLGPSFCGTEEKVVRHIEGNSLEKDLIDLVSITWDEIEKACVSPRKSRYS